MASEAREPGMIAAVFVAGSGPVFGLDPLAGSFFGAVAYPAPDRV